MDNILKFGENVSGYDIPVLNEREIRAAAGILFLILFTSVMLVILENNFLLLKYAVSIFFTDIMIRVFISPRYAPSLIVGRMIVRNQAPEYVGARQKKFAWSIGVVLSSIFFTMSVVVNSASPITGIICLVCLVFLFFEAAFGICLGCMFYPLFFQEKVQYCPGEACDVSTKQDIQKISITQVLIVVAFIGYIVLMAILFNDHFSQAPWDIFGLGTKNQ